MIEVNLNKRKMIVIDLIILILAIIFLLQSILSISFIPIELIYSYFGLGMTPQRIVGGFENYVNFVSIVLVLGVFIYFGIMVLTKDYLILEKNEGLSSLIGGYIEGLLLFGGLIFSAILATLFFSPGLVINLNYFLFAYFINWYLFRIISSIINKKENDVHESKILTIRWIMLATVFWIIIRIILFG